MLTKMSIWGAIDIVLFFIITMTLSFTGCRLHSGSMDVVDTKTASFLRNHVLHEIQFRSADISDVVLFIGQNVNPIGVGPDITQTIDKHLTTYRIGLHEQVKLRPPSECIDYFMQRMGHRLSLEYKNLNVFALLKEVAAQTGCHIIIGKDEVIIYTRKENNSDEAPSVISTQLCLDPF